jgi:hypothetical protein
MTNEDRRQDLISIFNKKYEKELHQFDQYIGQELYRVYNNGKIEAWTIESIYYQMIWNSKVSREYLEKLRQFIELPFDEDKLFFQIRHISEGWNSSTATTYNKILKGEFFIQKEDAEKESEKKKYEMILRDGNHWCRYCGKQKPESEMEYKQSYNKEFYRSGSRNTKHVRFVNFNDWFCKSGCRSYYEMAQEG